MPGKGKKPIGPDDMDQIVADLRVRAEAISAMSRAMQDEGMKTVEVMGTPMVRRGLKDIDRFILSCKRELGRI